MASGVNAEAVRIADAWHYKIQNLQTGFEKELNGLLPTLQRQGYAGEDELEAELRLSDGGIQVFFPKYHVLANVTLVESADSST